MAANLPPNPDFSSYKIFPFDFHDFFGLARVFDFFIWFDKVEEKSLKYYSKYFNDYMFKGKSLYNFWANENNPFLII